jgi:hypothetical protein
MEEREQNIFLIVNSVFRWDLINGKNFELSYNSNFSKHSKRWI